MLDDEEAVLDAIEILGLDERELMALTKHSRDEAWVWTETAKHDTDPETKEDHEILVAHFVRRWKRFNQLAAMCAAEQDQMDIDVEGETT